MPLSWGSSSLRTQYHSFGDSCILKVEALCPSAYL